MLASISGNRPRGPGDLNFTVYLSTAVASATLSANWPWPAAPLAGSMMCLADQTTSSAVSSLPLWNLTPLRILNVHSLESAFGVQLSASQG